MNKSSLTVVALAALALTGCSVPVADSPVGEGPAPTAAEPSQPPVENTNATFGSAVTYTDGVSISVSTPAPFTPSDTAAGMDQPNAVVFNVTMTNGSAENVDPFLYATASSGGVEASEIFDSEHNVGGSPSTTVLPGQTITYALAFSVADPNQITLEIQPTFDHDAAIFTH